MFIGDSVSRFQYLNLAHFLHVGNWNSEDGGKVIEEEATWGGWTEFLSGATQKLQPHSYKPSSHPGMGAPYAAEICDCWRDGLTDNVRVEGFDILAMSSIENRFYTSIEHGFRLSWLQSFGVHSMAGHNMSWLGLTDRDCTYSYLQSRTASNVGGITNSQKLAERPDGKFSCTQSGCQPGFCSKADYVHSWSQKIRAFTRDGDAGPVDALIINSGIWKSMEDKSLLEELLSAIGDVNDVDASLAVQKRAVYWKTTTPRSPLHPHPGFSELEPSVESAFLARNWSILDVRSLIYSLLGHLNESSFESSIFTPDLWHFKPWVYRAFNEALIGKLCQHDSPWNT